VPHQANARLIEAVGEQVGVPEDKCIVTVGEHGNTSSASIFLALARAFEQGRLEGRKRVLITTVGAGMLGRGALLDIDMGLSRRKP